jgi:long-chain acyl-CoA synthetase
MPSYYNQPKITAETLTEDGWLMTGDIGEWREDGCLAIIDRKKNLVKLAHGEYVAIEKLEAQYKTSKYVMNMCVHADPLQDHIIAIATPNEPEMVKLANHLGVEVGDYSNKAIHDVIAKDFLACAHAAGFKGAEILRAFVMVDALWTPENGMLTAAQKLDRKAILAAYSNHVKALYSK